MVPLNERQVCMHTYGLETHIHTQYTKNYANVSHSLPETHCFAFLPFSSHFPFLSLHVGDSLFMSNSPLTVEQTDG